MAARIDCSSRGIADLAKGEFAMAATFSKGVVIPEMLFAAFQATFAAITCCLVLGSVAERMKFSAVSCSWCSGSRSAICPSRTWCGSGWAGCLHGCGRG